ncbi:MAG: hypothetical protein GY696_20690 [Gammaproteobacteria bacterium]|nr:hypothetical protein [Gammaproteobacteria bacterium]
MAQREFKDYLQHPEEPAMMYFSAKRALWEKAFPDGGNIRDLKPPGRGWPAGMSDGS